MVKNITKTDEEIIMEFVEYLKSSDCAVDGWLEDSFQNVDKMAEEYLNSIGSVAEMMEEGKKLGKEFKEREKEKTDFLYTPSSKVETPEPGNVLEDTNGHITLNTPSSISSIKKEFMDKEILLGFSNDGDGEEYNDYMDEDVKETVWQFFLPHLKEVNYERKQ